MSFTITVDYTLPGVFSGYRLKIIPGRGQMKSLTPTLQSQPSALLWKRSPRNLRWSNSHNGRGPSILLKLVVLSSSTHCFIKFYCPNFSVFFFVFFFKVEHNLLIFFFFFFVSCFLFLFISRLFGERTCVKLHYSF